MHYFLFNFQSPFRKLFLSWMEAERRTGCLGGSFYSFIHSFSECRVPAVPWAHTSRPWYQSSKHDRGLCFPRTSSSKIQMKGNWINNKLKLRSQSDPTRNSKFTKKIHTKNKKRLKTASWFLHLDNLSSELAFNICWNVPIIKLSWL